MRNLILMLGVVAPLCAWGSSSFQPFPEFLRPDEDIFQRFGDGYLIASGAYHYVRLNLSIDSTVDVLPEDMNWKKEVPMALLVQEDRKIVVAIESEGDPLGWSFLHLARFLPDGSRDPSFGKDGIVSLNEKKGNTIDHHFAGMFLGVDKKLYIVANLNDGMRRREINLLRLRPTDGKVERKLVLNLAEEGPFRARPVQGGVMLTFNRFSEVFLAKFTLDGKAAPEFRAGAKSAGPEILESSVELLPDGKILMTGARTDGTITLARFLANGDPDSAFGKQGVLEESQLVNFGTLPHTLAVPSGNEHLYCGSPGAPYGSHTITSGGIISLVSPIVLSKSPSTDPRMVCEVAHTGVAIARYSAEGRLLSREATDPITAFYYQWPIAADHLQAGPGGSVDGVFWRGQESTTLPDSKFRAVTFRFF